VLAHAVAAVSFGGTPCIIPAMFWWLAVPCLAAPLDPLAFATLEDVLDPVGPVLVNTDAPSMTVDGIVYPGVFDGRVAVFAFGEVLLDQDVLVEGQRPLAILSHGVLRLDALLDASASGRVAGPGGYGGGDHSDGEVGEGTGGGSISNGSGAGGGGFGGPGGEAEDGVDGGISYGDLIDVGLDGGSGGGKSNDICGWIVIFYTCWENGTGGGGGGAVELGAAGPLSVGPLGVVAADGAAGSGDSDHGGGGGAGGGILLHGRGGVCEGTLTARGGDGGAGSGGQDGGAGGGGRIVMRDLHTPCQTDVSGGAGPGGAAQPGEVLFQEWVPPDADGDGFNEDEECDDDNPDVNPGETDIPGDGIDQDCDGADAVEQGTLDTGGGDTGATDTTVDPGGAPAEGAPSNRTGQRDPSLEGGSDAVAGCGCGSAGGRGMGLLLAAAALAARRRSRSGVGIG
jgi:hypothetical protein